jgi:hypothetical protein
MMPGADACRYLPTIERQEAQKHIITMLQSRGRWDRATKRGKDALSQVTNGMLLLQQLRGDWGILATLKDLPSRVSAALRRRVHDGQARLAREHSLLCENFGQMRSAAWRLQELRDNVATASWHPATSVQSLPVAVSHLYVHSIMSLDNAVAWARTVVTMFGKELVAKRLVMREFSRDPGTDGGGWHGQTYGARSSRGCGDGGQMDTRIQATTLDRELAGIYISSWMLEPMLDQRVLDEILNIFRHEVKDVGALIDSPARRSPISA